MRKEVDRLALFGPKGSERRKFMEQPRTVQLGKKGLDEATAKNLKKLMKDIDAGKVPEGFPKKVLERAKRLKSIKD